MTIGELLKVLDPNGERDDELRIMGNNGDVELQGKTKSPVWEHMAELRINSLQAYGQNVLNIWLEKEPVCSFDKSTESDSIPKKRDTNERAQKTYENYVRFRDRKRLTDNKVATRAGVASATMSSWKSGKYTPKEEKICAIAQVLGISPEEITDY